MEARAIAIRGDDGVFGGDKNRCSLELRYPADTPIAVRDITPAQVVDSYTCHVDPVTMSENILQVLNSEVASRGALSRMLRKEQ